MRATIPASLVYLGIKGTVVAMDRRTGVEIWRTPLKGSQFVNVTLATDAPPTIPATSTINFPVGDPRANGVTVKLSVSGKLTAVYKAVPGRTTHLVLDVTGYYVNDLSGARFVPLTPGRRMDTRVPAPMEGLSGAFSANFSRTLIIEPYQGVPGNATAITGNLTVVGQTRAGFVSMTQVATSNPSTSTLNFPLGDVRANGVTLRMPSR
jgi:hypothetical protein